MHCWIARLSEEMRRGFKTQAEQISEALRKNQSLTVLDKFEPKLFLESLGIIVWTPAEVPGLEAGHLEQLTVKDADCWSGVAIRVGDRTVIIVNSTHPTTRQANTLMHEWAHIELRHKPNRVDRSEGGLLLLSDYPAEFEEEADWLAASVLLPRAGLVQCKSRGMHNDDIARHYGVSSELANWRVRMTGVERQISARRHYY
ncbi:ImmA/IrrE family metallo-endopeptidase [Rhizobium bangladeshense]|uniref:ImmA/IrrE family metallo-endopeptidase n=1 Tax=Rhizobium bangladeshense TaxID=1138189 RepID=UPI001C83961F|nr:ImmA/IrrE family metallo-endopeptidase [Rhizobium bangladeshense]